MTAKTYKAIFTCPAQGERVVWYVSSRHKAVKMMNGHICGHKKRLKAYRGLKLGQDYFLKCTPLFQGLPDVGIIDTSSFMD